MSQLFDSQTTSRLHAEPVFMGGLQMWGVSARIQNVPAVQSESALHSGGAAFATLMGVRGETQANPAAMTTATEATSLRSMMKVLFVAAHGR
jgi:hypothetical protein